MFRRAVVAGLLLAGVLSAQDSAAGKAERYDFHALMLQIWEAWGTLNPANAAKFYSKDPERVFFDLFSSRYAGWSEYEAGARRSFGDYTSARFDLTGRSRISQRPTLAWATATGHCALTKKTGDAEELDFRWTVIWQKEGNDWLIVHEQVSVLVPVDYSLAPIPPPSPPADTAQASPRTLRIGQTKSEVIAALGQPEKVAKLDEKEIFYYKDLGRVTFVNGKVTEVQ